MITFFIMSTWLLLAWKLGKWEKFREMLPTILLYMIFNLLYNIIYFHQLLWEYQSRTSYLNHTSIALLFIFVTVPCSIIVFLSYLPLKNSYLYLAFWIALYSSLEWIATNVHLFTYHNGWSFRWSVVFNVIMFTTLFIHYRRPFIAIVFSIVMLVGLLLVFPPSFEKMV